MADKMQSIAAAYARNIERKKITLEDVPENIRHIVKEIIESKAGA